MRTAAKLNERTRRLGDDWFHWIISHTPKVVIDIDKDTGEYYSHIGDVNGPHIIAFLKSNKVRHLCISSDKASFYVLNSPEQIKKVTEVIEPYMNMNKGIEDDKIPENV